MDGYLSDSQCILDYLNLFQILSGEEAVVMYPEGYMNELLTWRFSTLGALELTPVWNHDNRANEPAASRFQNRPQGAYNNGGRHIAGAGHSYKMSGSGNVIRFRF